MKPKILHIEDNEVDRLVVKRLLEEGIEERRKQLAEAVLGSSLFPLQTSFS